jgi:uncharacterized protein YwbE
MNFESQVFLDELRKADAVFEQTPTGLATALGLNVGRVSSAFQGKGRLSKGTVEAISKHCNCKPLYLELRLIERQIAWEIQKKIDS